MIELRSSVSKRKPLIALTEDAAHAGLSMNEVLVQLRDADSSYEKWGFGDDEPRSEALYEALFTDEPIEWNRIGAFQE